ncbi:MAG: MFS transporter, partial [Propionicimonas sp.]
MTSAALDSPRAWFMWSLGVLAYTAAVMQRTSFGVASVMATERFSAGASLVSLFVVVQLLTYAAMQ